jgi:fructokinase
MTRSVFCGGYVVLDVVCTASTTWHQAGGTAANVAANLAYLGRSAGLVARIGADAAGRAVYDHLAAAGVDTSWLDLDADVTTPIVIHEVTPPKHRYRFGCPNCGRGSAIYRPAAAVPPVAADVFFFDRPSRVNLELAETHRRHGAVVVYEPSTRATINAHQSACAAATIVKFSSQRADQITARLPRRVAGQVWIETHGADGADVVTSARRTRVPSPEVPSIDDGGAGDWMTAGIIYQLSARAQGVTEDDVVIAVEWSSALAALSTTVAGARTLAEAVPRHRLADRLRAVKAGRQVRLSVDTGEDRGRGMCICCGLPMIDS